MCYEDFTQRVQFTRGHHQLAADMFGGKDVEMYQGCTMDVHIAILESDWLHDINVDVLRVAWLIIDLQIKISPFLTRHYVYTTCRDVYVFKVTVCISEP